MGLEHVRRIELVAAEQLAAALEPEHPRRRQTIDPLEIVRKEAETMLASVSQNQSEALREKSRERSRPRRSARSSARRALGARRIAISK